MAWDKIATSRARARRDYANGVKLIECPYLPGGIVQEMNDDGTLGKSHRLYPEMRRAWCDEWKKCDKFKK